MYKNSIVHLMREVYLPSSEAMDFNNQFTVWLGNLELEVFPKMLSRDAAY